jgi:hypothetical protein
MGSLEGINLEQVSETLSTINRHKAIDMSKVIYDNGNNGHHFQKYILPLPPLLLTLLSPYDKEWIALYQLHVVLMFSHASRNSDI